MEKMYDKAIRWLQENTNAHGDAAELMRRANAPKASWYKLLQGKGVRSESFLEWLENLGFTLKTPDEQGLEPPRPVCFVQSGRNEGGAAQVPAERDFLAVPLVTELGEQPGPTLPGFESFFLVSRNEPSIRLRTHLVAVRLGKASVSMEPTLHPGDTVIVDRADKVVSQPGHLWMVLDPESATGKVRRVKIDPVHGKRLTRITYYADNVQTTPPEVYTLEEDFAGDIAKAILGRVVWSWSDMTRK